MLFFSPYTKNKHFYDLMTVERWAKEFILPFPKKGNVRTTENYRLIILSAKIHNTLLLNHIWYEVEKKLKCFFFWRNQSPTSLILTIPQIIQVQKNLEATVLFVDFLPLTRRKDGTNTYTVWFSKGNCYCYNGLWGQ